jgi:hypothetical protein
MIIKVVLFEKVLNPLTFNDDINETLLFNEVNPLTFNDENNVVLLFNFVIPETFNDVVNNVSPLTFKANIPGLVVFIANPVAFIICLSEPFILYVIFPEFDPGKGSPPQSSLIITSLFTFEFALPNVLNP